MGLAAPPTGVSNAELAPFARQIGMLAPDGSRADRAKAAFNAKPRLLARLRVRPRP